MASVGIDLGGTKCLGVAMVDGAVVAEDRVETPKEGGEALLETMAELAAGIAAACGSPLTGVGVGVPGLVALDGGLRLAPNLRNAAGLAVRAGLERRLGVPVEVDNDATCAAWGEQQLGVAQGLSDVILVALGTGIGGGIVTQGRIHRGANRFAGEIGHMVVDPSGPPCPCGQRGCWERFASGSGLGNLAREAAVAGRATRIVDLAGGDAETVRGEHVTLALAEGDAEAEQVIADFAWWVALGLSNLANAFDPEAFVIGGGLIVSGEALLAPIRAALAAQLPGFSLRRPIAVLPAALGLSAGAIGAACLVAGAP
jgi:glucokinase